MRFYPWLPSGLGAVASGAFLVMHMSQRWIIAGEPTPLLVPGLLCLVIFAACVVDAGLLLLRGEPGEALLAEITTPEPAGDKDDHPPVAPPDYRRLAWYLGSLVAFAVLMEPLGFVAVVLIVMPLLLIFGEHVAPARAIRITLITGAVVYLVFVRLLAVDLPAGSLWWSLF